MSYQIIRVNGLSNVSQLLSHWSVSIEQSVAGNKDDITDTLAVLQSAEN